MKGKAYIIGVGPGDEELITLRAKNLLEECTVVLYDRLVGNNILNYINENCKVLYCGKEPGAHYKTQEEINEILVDLALKGEIVGRVKGGDPYVFGRGGEEVLALKEKNIEFEVVPGITSAISVLNYAGIPVTHRGISQSFHVVTGMTAGAEKVNWSALAKESGTLIFLMGLDNLSLIINNLISNGKDSKSSCAVVMRGTSAKQKKVIGKLYNIEDKVKEAGLKSPCIIVVGEVVKLSESLSWYENKPLFGENICITRSRNQSSSLKKKLRALGAEVTEINSIEFKNSTENLDKYLNKLEEYKYIVFTSQNAVNYFFDYLISKSYDIRKIKADFAVVGKATKNVLAQRGIQAKVMAREFVGEGLVKELLPIVDKGDKILLPCSSIAREVIEEELSKKGAIVNRVNIYEVIKGRINNLKAFDEVDSILFTSPSTVKNMIDMMGVEAIDSKNVIAIGPQTYKELEKNNIKALICKKHSEDGFIEEVVELVSKKGV